MIKLDVTKKLQEFYQERLSKDGVTYSTVWGDTSEWKALERFKIVENSDFSDNDLITDLGCGNGLLCKYINQFMPSVKYLGVDVVPEFLKHVTDTYAAETCNINFFNNVEMVPESEWYAIFGSLNKKWMVGLNDEQPVDIVYEWIDKIFLKSKKGIFLNCFSARTNSPKQNNVHLDPFKILELLDEKVKYYRIRHDLEFYEFSLMIGK